MRDGTDPYDQGTARNPGEDSLYFSTAEERIMNFWKSVGGMLEVELVSAEPEMV